MNSLRSWLVLVVVTAACTRENPAFEGGDELLEGSSGKEDVEGESASVGSEGVSSSQTTSEGETTSNASTSEGTGTSTSTSEGSTSSESTSSESTSDPTESSSSSGSTDTLDTFGTLDAPDPIEECPLIFVVVTCFDCITSVCCDSLTNSYCFVPSGCNCMTQCLANGELADACANQCAPSETEQTDALALWECGKLNCEQHCL